MIVLDYISVAGLLLNCKKFYNQRWELKVEWILNVLICNEISFYDLIQLILYKNAILQKLKFSEFVKTEKNKDYDEIPFISY